MNNFVLQNFIQNGSSSNYPEPKYKKQPKGASQQLQLTLATVFNEVKSMLQQNNMDLDLPEQIKSVQKINLFKTIITNLLKINQKNQNLDQDSNQIIKCKDCKQYQKSLQKLQNQVRQHIRLEQQLKIYQDSQQQKIQQAKKQKKDLQKKLQSFKKQSEDIKNFNTTITQKVNKLQHENQNLKKQLRQYKRNTSTNQQIIQTKRQSNKQYGYQGKQNWAHRNVSIKKQQKQQKGQRRSVQKRLQSGQKNWRNSVNAKSNKMLSIMNEKIMNEKNKEQRRKIIQSKFQYRK